MKFSTFFGFAALALAAPSVLQEERAVAAAASSPLSDIHSALQTLQKTVTPSCDKINKAVKSAKGSKDGAKASVSAGATCKTEYGNIYKAISTCVTSVTKTTVKSGGGVAYCLKGVKQSDVSLLVEIVNLTKTIINLLSTTIHTTSTTLSAGTYKSITSQVGQVKGCIGTVTVPIIVLSNACTNGAKNQKLSLSVLISARASLSQTLSGIFRLLSLSDLTSTTSHLLGSLTTSVGGAALKQVSGGPSGLCVGLSSVAKGISGVVTTLSGVLGSLDGSFGGASSGGKTSGSSSSGGSSSHDDDDCNCPILGGLLNGMTL